MKHPLPLCVASLLLSITTIVIGNHLSATSLLISSGACLMAACLMMGRALYSQAEER